MRKYLFQLAMMKVGLLSPIFLDTTVKLIMKLVHTIKNFEIKHFVQNVFGKRIKQSKTSALLFAVNCKLEHL